MTEIRAKKTRDGVKYLWAPQALELGVAVHWRGRLLTPVRKWDRKYVLTGYAYDYTEVVSGVVCQSVDAGPSRLCPDCGESVAICDC